MIIEKKFTSKSFSILFKNGKIGHYDCERKSNEPMNRYREINDFINNHSNEIDCLAIKGSSWLPGTPAHFFFTPKFKVDNIILTVANESSYYFVDTKFLESTNTNYFIYLKYPNTDFILNDLDLYGGTKIKFLLSPMGHFGYNNTVKGTSGAMDLNPNIDTEKLKQLKKYNKLLWAGSYYGFRKEQMSEIESLGIEIVKLKTWMPPYEISKENCEFLSSRDRYIDTLIKHKCCAVLSLDGGSVGCPRDTESTLSYVPNLKYTRTNQVDVSVGGGVYLARGISEVKEKFEQIKYDLNKEDYTKILRARTWMYNTWSMKNRKMIDVSLIAFAMFKNINTDNVILHPAYSHTVNDDDWAKTTGNINNFK